MKKIIFILLIASALYSATYEVKKIVSICKDGLVEKQIQTNKTSFSYQVKRYKTVCVKADNKKSKENVK